MAYTAANLSLMHSGGAGNAKTYTYISTDAVATVAAADYFLTDYLKLKPGDIIDIVVVDAVAPATRTAATAISRKVIGVSTSVTVTTVAST